MSDAIEWLSELDFYLDRIARTKQDIDYVRQTLESCKDKEQSERLHSILTGLFSVQIRNQRVVEILKEKRKMSDVIEWLSELDYGIQVQIQINDVTVFEGILNEFLNQTSDDAVKAVSKVLAVENGVLVPPYIFRDTLIVNIKEEI